VAAGEKKLVGVMSYDLPGAGAPDYGLYQLGGSKLRFRGRAGPPGPGAIAVLGGDAVFGRFVDDPFCAILERTVGRDCLNLGMPNAGVDMVLHDPAVLRCAAEASPAVVQVFGAANLTNRYYAVHPRRNDRLISVSRSLRAIYREVDFTEFHFTRHLLSRLQRLSPDRFSAVQDELQRVWTARMRRLLAACGPDTVLLWIEHLELDPLGAEPVFVTRAMVDALVADAGALVHLSVRRAGPALSGMAVGPMDGLAAARMIGPEGHARIAAALAGVLRT
jgi:hypothetical protein